MAVISRCRLSRYVSRVMAMKFFVTNFLRLSLQFGSSSALTWAVMMLRCWGMEKDKNKKASHACCSYQLPLAAGSIFRHWKKKITSSIYPKLLHEICTHFKTPMIPSFFTNHPKHFLKISTQPPSQTKGREVPAPPILKWAGKRIANQFKLYWAGSSHSTHPLTWKGIRVLILSLKVYFFFILDGRCDQSFQLQRYHSANTFHL